MVVPLQKNCRNLKVLSEQKCSLANGIKTRERARPEALPEYMLDLARGPESMHGRIPAAYMLYLARRPVSMHGWIPAFLRLRRSFDFFVQSQTTWSLLNGLAPFCSYSSLFSDFCFSAKPWHGVPRPMRIIQ